jgi:hypothetical protein
VHDEHSWCLSTTSRLKCLVSLLDSSNDRCYH